MSVASKMYLIVFTIVLAAVRIECKSIQPTIIEKNETKGCAAGGKRYQPNVFYLRKVPELNVTREVTSVTATSVLVGGPRTERTILLTEKPPVTEGDPCVSVSDGYNGTCVRAHRCLSVVLDHKMGRIPQLCSSKGEEMLVCCTDCELVKDTSSVLVSERGLHYRKTGQKATDKCLEYITSFQYNCTMDVTKGFVRYPPWYYGSEKQCYTYGPGERSRLRNLGVGGEDGYRGQFPHMALLGYGKDLDSAQWLCGGSVISDQFILTAGHCIAARKLGSVRFVNLGILKRTDPVDIWQIYDVVRTIPHPHYRPPSKYHDIALLAVSTKIKFGNYVLPACLQVGESDETDAKATGWGRLGPREELADTLQVVQVDRFSASECAGAYPSNRHMVNGFDHKTQTCYGNRWRIVDTCPGDSGGPLQVSSSHGMCVYNIVGVTSFGTACGHLGSAGVYTKVDHYIPWIEGIVWP